LEIHLATNDDKKTFTIQDTGIGLTKEELIDCLGTIAKSGSKVGFSMTYLENPKSLQCCLQGLEL